MPFVDNIWGADLADAPLMSKFNKGICFLLYVIDIFSKYAWVISLKDKKGITFADGFKKILDESNHKPNKIGVGKGRKFSNRPMKSWLKKKNAMEIHSTHNNGKFVVAERFIRTFKIKIYKYMISILKIVYIDKLDDTVNK